MSELSAADRWLSTVLSGDVALRALVSGVYDTKAPQGTARPYVLFSLHAPSADITVIGNIRIGNRPLYLVRAVCDGPSWTPVRTIADRIDELLHGASGSNVDGIIYGCVREQPFKALETVEGKDYCWLGGYYRLWAQES